MKNVAFPDGLCVMAVDFVVIRHIIVLIDPVLPVGFFDRGVYHDLLLAGVVFIDTTGKFASGRVDIWCLDGAELNGPTLWGSFVDLESAIVGCNVILGLKGYPA